MSSGTKVGLTNSSFFCRQQLFLEFRQEIDRMSYRLFEKPYEDLSEFRILEIRTDANELIGEMIVCENGYVDCLYVRKEFRREGWARKAVLDYLDSGGEISSFHITNTNEVAYAFWTSIFELEIVNGTGVDSYFRVVKRRDPKSKKKPPTLKHELGLLFNKKKAMEEFKQTHRPAICKNCGKNIYPGERIIILDFVKNRLRSLFCDNDCLNAFIRSNKILVKNCYALEPCISVKDMDYISCFGKIEEKPEKRDQEGNKKGADHE